jgi:serine/threonine-protein kinase
VPTPPPAQILASLAQPGDLVAGKYRVERVMAIGGMGVVVAARHEDLDQPVAIKLLRQDALSNAEAVARFLREARTAAKLQGEHIARVFDVGTTDEGIPFMVMEFLSGQDLQQILETNGPLPVRDAVDHVLQALEAVAEAHAAGVVHRDLKPSNLFLATRPDGSRIIKVLDFGISRGQGLDTPTDGQVLTATKQVMGSPGYMSPEQMTRPRGVDGRTDIWSIGVVLYALLTGEQPFQGETVAAVMASILHDPLPRVRAKRSDVPAALERVIERCLERDVTVRYATVAQVARALAPLGSERARLSVESVERSLEAASPAGKTLLRMAEVKPDDSGAIASTAWAGAALGQGSRRKLLVGLAAGTALAAALGVGLWLGRSGGPAAVSGPAAMPRLDDGAPGRPTAPAAPNPVREAPVAPAASAAAAAPAASAAAGAGPAGTRPGPSSTATSVARPGSVVPGTTTTSKAGRPIPTSTTKPANDKILGERK